jgi:uncharacterized protein YuzE
MSKNTVKRNGAIDYDAQNDSFFAYSKGVKYKSSVDLDGILLDIAEDNSIMGVEVLGVSNRFGISKYDVQNYKSIEVSVKITEKAIDVHVTLSVLKRNAEISRVAEASALNSMNLPVGSDSLAVVA